MAMQRHYLQPPLEGSLTTQEDDTCMLLALQ